MPLLGSPESMGPSFPEPEVRARLPNHLTQVKKKGINIRVSLFLLKIRLELLVFLQQFGCYLRRFVVNGRQRPGELKRIIMLVLCVLNLFASARNTGSRASRTYTPKQRDCASIHGLAEKPRFCRLGKAQRAQQSMICSRPMLGTLRFAQPTPNSCTVSELGSDNKPEFSVAGRITSHGIPSGRHHKQGPVGKEKIPARIPT